jgi:hypothetical protein
MRRWGQQGMVLVAFAEAGKRGKVTKRLITV